MKTTITVEYDGIKIDKVCEHELGELEKVMIVMTEGLYATLAKKFARDNQWDKVELFNKTLAGLKPYADKYESYKELLKKVLL
jgi:hypothetical protein